LRRKAIESAAADGVIESALARATVAVTLARWDLTAGTQTHDTPISHE